MRGLTTLAVNKHTDHFVCKDMKPHQHVACTMDQNISVLKELSNKNIVSQTRQYCRVS